MEQFKRQGQVLKLVKPKLCGTCGKEFLAVPAASREWALGEKPGKCWECDGTYHGKPCESTCWTHTSNIEKEAA